MVRALQTRYCGEVYLVWERRHHSVAVWPQGQWLHAALWDTVEDVLSHLAEAEGVGVARRRVQRIEDALIQRAGG